MFPLQATGSVAVIKPQSVASSATATGNIDTMGFDSVKVVVMLDSAASTTSKPVVLKLSQADTTDASNFADVTGFVGDSTTIPAVSATLPTIVVMDVVTRARKRYLKLSVTPSTAGAMLLSAVAVLGKAESMTSARAKAAKTFSG